MNVVLVMLFFVTFNAFLIAAADAEGFSLFKSHKAKLVRFISKMRQKHRTSQRQQQQQRPQQEFQMPQKGENSLVWDRRLQNIAGLECHCAMIYSSTPLLPHWPWKWVRHFAGLGNGHQRRLSPRTRGIFGVAFKTKTIGSDVVASQWGDLEGIVEGWFGDIDVEDSFGTLGATERRLLLEATSVGCAIFPTCFSGDEEAGLVTVLTCVLEKASSASEGNYGSSSTAKDREIETQTATEKPTISLENESFVESMDDGSGVVDEQLLLPRSEFGFENSHFEVVESQNPGERASSSPGDGTTVSPRTENLEGNFPATNQFRITTSTHLSMGKASHREEQKRIFTLGTLDTNVSGGASEKFHDLQQKANENVGSGFASVQYRDIYI